MFVAWVESLLARAKVLLSTVFILYDLEDFCRTGYERIVLIDPRINREYKMLPLEFFKLQAKHLHSDLKTRTSPSTDLGMFYGDFYYDYDPKFFDVKQLMWDLELSEEPGKLFSLMKCQHIIARLMGFNSWSELIHAPDKELELRKLIFENQNKINPQEWQMYIFDVISALDAQGVHIFSTDNERELYERTLSEYDPSDPFHRSGYLLDKKLLDAAV